MMQWVDKYLMGAARAWGWRGVVLVVGLALLVVVVLVALAVWVGVDVAAIVDRWGR